MKDATTGMVEADITINGEALSFAESMSLRVAVGSFRLWLSEPENRNGLGLRLANNYDRLLAGIERLIIRGVR